MNRKRDLKSYLLHWKENIACDVTGQSAVGPHLGEEVLKEMACSIDGIDNASAEDMNHLSFCPECLERWSGYFGRDEDLERVNAGEQLSMTYGTMDGDDVVGQSGNLILQSQCRRFTLSVVAAPDTPEYGTVTVETSDQTLNQVTIQVRDRSGTIVIEGTIENGILRSESISLGAFDLALWTVMKKSSD